MKVAAVPGMLLVVALASTVSAQVALPNVMPGPEEYWVPALPWPTDAWPHPVPGATLVLSNHGADPALAQVDGAQVGVIAAAPGSSGSLPLAIPSEWASGVHADRSLRVLAPPDAALAVHLPEPIVFVNDALGAIPSTSLGTEHLVPMLRPYPPDLGQNSSSQNGSTPLHDGFYVAVAALQPTTITVHAPMEVTGAPGFAAKPAHVPFSVTLGRYDTLYLHSKDTVAGTWVNASAPIAVYAGSGCLASDHSSCDAIVDVVPPIDALADAYTLCPTTPWEIQEPVDIWVNATTNPGSLDHYQVLAVSNDTAVHIDPPPVEVPTGYVVLDAGRDVVFNASVPTRVWADGRLMVQRTLLEGPGSNGDGDPAWAPVLPAPSWNSRTALWASPFWVDTHAIVTAPAGTDVQFVSLVPGQSVEASDWRAIDKDACARVKLTPGTYTVVASAPVHIHHMATVHDASFLHAVGPRPVSVPDPCIEKSDPYVDEAEHDNGTLSWNGPQGRCGPVVYTIWRVVDGVGVLMFQGTGDMWTDQGWSPCIQGIYVMEPRLGHRAGPPMHIPFSGACDGATGPDDDPGGGDGSDGDDESSDGSDHTERDTGEKGVPDLAGAPPRGATNDEDRDGAADPIDNCPGRKNRGQADRDHDARGDRCDLLVKEVMRDAPKPDRDQDGVIDDADNCVTIRNRDQRDTDLDGVGDACDLDMDGDRIPNGKDTCPETPGGSCRAEMAMEKPGPGPRLASEAQTGACEDCAVSRAAGLPWALVGAVAAAASFVLGARAARNRR